MNSRSSLILVGAMVAASCAVPRSTMAAWPAGYGPSFGRVYNHAYGDLRYGSTSRYRSQSRYSYGARFGYGSPYGYGARFGSAYAARLNYGARAGVYPYGYRSYISPRIYGRYPTQAVPRTYVYRPNYSGAYRPGYAGSLSYLPWYLAPRHAYVPQASVFPAPLQQPQQVPIGQTDMTATSADEMDSLAGVGWSLFEQGQSAEALEAFSAQSTRNPTKGGPKIGYALAAAQMGDLSTGVWAMRRACEIDAHAMHYLVLTEGQRQQVETLVQRYSSATGAPQDRFFMAAALHYIVGDASAAQVKIDEAIEAGDRSQGATVLKKLIAERNSEHVTARPLVIENGATTLPAPQ